MKLCLACIAALLVIAGSAAPSIAYSPGPAPGVGPTHVALKVPGGMSVPRGGLVERVQGRACRWCRRACYRDFRIDCGYSNWCRRQFSRCMRECWYEYCR